MDLNTVMVVGAGTMGNGIAHVFAQNGFSVILHDVTQELLDRAFKTIEAPAGTRASRSRSSLAVHRP